MKSSLALAFLLSQVKIINGQEIKFGNNVVGNNAYSHYNNICKASCDGSSTSQKAFPFESNPCPKCSEKYSHEHCNHCCSGGATSLKLRWHGCKGIFTSQPSNELVSRCNNLKHSPNNETHGVKFMRCNCLDSVLNGNPFHECERDLIDYAEVGLKGVNGSSLDEEDICVVSAKRNQNGEWTLAMNEVLPNPLVLELNELPNAIEEEPLNEYPLTTLFDTSCSTNMALQNHLFKDGALPLYPKYGKLPNTCENEGFVDFANETTKFSSKSNQRLPDSLDHESNPPVERFWFEFLDGSSKSFWPSNRYSNSSPDSFLQPSFASCSCIECPTNSPSAAPSILTSPIGKVSPCKECINFIGKNCMANDDSECIYTPSDLSPTGRSRSLETNTQQNIRQR